MIHERRDSATGLAITQGDECLDLGIIVEGVVPVIEQFLLHHPQRRNPVRIAPIVVPRKIEEQLTLGTGRNRDDFQLRHSRSLPGEHEIKGKADVIGPL
jgi:hypothetical protein